MTTTGDTSLPGPPRPAVVACCWRPDPAHGSPPPCWVAAATSRQRLEHACAVLRWYGVAAHLARGDDPEVTRSRLRTAILAGFPQAKGAYVFWTASDDQDCFTADGNLTGPLTLYVDGSNIGRSARAAFDLVGLSVEDGPRPGTLLIGPAR